MATISLEQLVNDLNLYPFVTYGVKVIVGILDEETCIAPEFGHKVHPHLNKLKNDETIFGQLVDEIEFTLRQLHYSKDRDLYKVSKLGFYLHSYVSSNHSMRYAKVTNPTIEYPY